MAQLMMALGNAPANPPTGYSTLYVKADGYYYCKTAGGTETQLSGASGGGSFPPAGVPLSTGTAWGVSYTVGLGANNLVQLDSLSRLPAVDGSALTNVTATASTIPASNTSAATHYAIGGVPLSSSNAQFYYNNSIYIQGSTGTIGTVNLAAAGWVGLSGSSSGATYLNAAATAGGNLTLPAADSTLLASVTAPAANPITGTPTAAKFLRGDGTWQFVSSFVGYTNVVSAGTTTTLTAASTLYQHLSGTQNQTFQLPDATTLAVGYQFIFDDDSTGSLIIKDGSGSVIYTIYAGGFVTMYLVDTSTTAGSWMGYIGVPSNVVWGSAGVTIPMAMTLGSAGSTAGSVSLWGASGVGSTTVTASNVSGTPAALSLPGTSDTICGIAASQALTNKRVTARYVSTTQSATPTINTDNTDVAYITGLAQAITSMTTHLSGTPNGGDCLLIEITDNGTAQAITWGTSFESSTVTLPSTTVLSTKLTVAFLWNTTTTKWRCVGVA